MLAKNLAYFAKADGAGHRARRPRSGRADVAGGFAAGADGLLRRRGALRRCAAPSCAGSRRVIAMDTILVVNAGSSSVKFQIFAVDGERQAAPADQGPDGRHRQPTAVARERCATAIRWPTAPIRSRASQDVPAALAVAGDWLRDELRISPLAVGHRVVHGGPDYDRPVLIDHGVLTRLGAFVALAPLHQPHNLAPIRSLLDQFPDAAAGRLLRHRLSPQPWRAGRPLRDPAPASCRGRQALRISRPVLRIHRQDACRKVAPEIARRPGDRRPSRQRRFDVRAQGAGAASRARWVLLRSTGLPMGTRPGPDRSRRCALSDLRKGHVGRRTCRISSTANAD